MKRKWKWFVLLLLAVVFFVAVIWFIPGKNVPVQVTEGELSDAEISEIIASVKREMRKDILRDFSWKSFRGLPTALRHYGSIKLYSIRASWETITNREKGVVVCWWETNGFRMSVDGPGTSSVPRVKLMHSRGAPERAITILHRSNRWDAVPPLFDPRRD